jgi:hypothetical protein
MQGRCRKIIIYNNTQDWLLSVPLLAGEGEEFMTA